MNALTPEQIASITGGKLLGKNLSLELTRVSIDSRQILNPTQTLFVALKGAKADGAKFIPQLIEEGVQVFLVSESFQIQNKETCYIAVKDTRKALQSLAKYQRELFEKPVVSITGSNGKTIVKEWLGQILSQNYAVAKSPKSYNSQVGLPLSVFEIQPYHQVAILEVGVSKKGEMEALQAIAQPNLGVFTNIGTAHDEGFESREEKIKEKLQLFKDSALLVYNKDQKELSKIIETAIENERLIAWSDQPGADYTRAIKFQDELTKIILIKSDLSTFTFYTRFSDQASLENLTHTIVAALSLGMLSDSIQKGINLLRQVDMRLTLKPGINDSLIIDDTYNNDLAGLRVSLDFMRQQRPKRRKILFLSEFQQQGQPEKIYPEVAELINSHSLDLVVAVGENIHPLQELIQSEFKAFASTQELSEWVGLENFSDDLILITGARAYHFEQIVNQLQQRIHGTTLEINLNALTHNFNFYKRRIKPETKVMVMVKAFAYGGGAVEIANHLQTLGADYLAVAFTDEGVILRKQGIQLPIMVLNPVQESFELCKTYDLEPVVFSLEFFTSLGNWCKNNQTQLKVHLDLDTGMRRLGFEEGHLEALSNLIKTYPELIIQSLYTHLVGADEEIHRDYSQEQLDSFIRMKDQILPHLSQKPLLHALNSAGIVAFPDYQLDMVRLGIGLYGVEVTGKHDRELQAISTLKTTISQVKRIEPGETIGYSRKGRLENGGKIATLSIGYADGYDRRFSNGKGYVLIHGKKAPVIGNVCMDMVMVDVTDIEVKAGDEAIIYGSQISLKDLADRIGTIPYELLTNISSRVKRVYYLD